jgi:uncharacterized protein YtpQ (UPF0354 family)
MSDAMRTSIQRRVIELLRRQLPAGWTCQAEGEGLLISRNQGEELLKKQISLASLYTRIERNPEERREALYAFVSQVAALIRGQSADRQLTGQEANIYPVIRHASQAKGANWIARQHTEETVVAYALDHGDGYSLIDGEMLRDAGWSDEKLHRCAMDNLERLPYSIKTQYIGEHAIHFISPTDGYAASRVLLQPLLDEMDRTKTGNSLGVAVPHQDVLILADLHDDNGAQLLARLTFDFASKGPTPICPLPFFYEQGELIPFLVVQHGDATKRKKKGEP